MTMKKVSGDLAKNRDYLDRQLGVGESFDVLYRNVEIGKKNAALYMIDGFCKDEVMQKLLQHFIGITKEQMPEDAAEMSRQLVPYGEVDLCDDLDEICRQVMSGVTALLLEGYEQGILIDARTYPARSVGEPEKDKVLRGSKDGFVETIVFNTALIRRRIRSTQLRMEMLQAGKTSHTDIVLCYMEDRVDQQFLEKIRNRIQNLQVDAITGTYLRLSRLLIAIVTYFLTPTFLLLMEYPQWIPKGFEFIAVRDTVYIPLIWQLLLLELAIDGLKLAAVNTPNMLSTPLSVMAALVLGEFSVKSGWFNSEVMLYMAFVAVANYTQNSLELGYALKFMRIINLVLTAIFGVWGYVGGIVILAVSLLFNRTVSSRSYLYPLVPFHGKQLGHQLFRTRLPAARK